jgi:hypothetical protein
MDPRDVVFVTLDGSVTIVASWADHMEYGDGSLVAAGVSGWWYGTFDGDGGQHPGRRLGFYNADGWWETVDLP